MELTEESKDLLIEKLYNEIKILKKMPSNKNSLIYVIFGIFFTTLSVLNMNIIFNNAKLNDVFRYLNGGSSVLLYLGLSMLLWGGILYYVYPISYLRYDICETSLYMPYQLISRILNEFNANSKGFYIPPFSEDVYLPEYLEGLKSEVILLTTRDTLVNPPISDIANGKFILKNEDGILITPPGLGITKIIEKEMKRSITNVSLDDLYFEIPRILCNELRLAKKILISQEENVVDVVIFDSVIKQDYAYINIINIIGSPIVSAIACALSKSTGKIVAIDNEQEMGVSQIHVKFKLIEG